MRTLRSTGSVSLKTCILNWKASRCTCSSRGGSLLWSRAWISATLRWKRSMFSSRVTISLWRHVEEDDYGGWSLSKATSDGADGSKPVCHYGMKEEGSFTCKALMSSSVWKDGHWATTSLLEVQLCTAAPSWMTPSHRVRPRCRFSR